MDQKFPVLPPGGGKQLQRKQLIAAASGGEATAVGVTGGLLGGQYGGQLKLENLVGGPSYLNCGSGQLQGYYQ